MRSRVTEACREEEVEAAADANPEPAAVAVTWTAPSALIEAEAELVANAAAAELAAEKVAAAVTADDGRLPLSSMLRMRGA